jgi:hypothetical protein
MNESERACKILLNHKRVNSFLLTVVFLRRAEAPASCVKVAATTTRRVRENQEQSLRLFILSCEGEMF